MRDFVWLPAFAAKEVFLADEILLNYYSQGGGPGVCETLSLDTCSLHWNFSLNEAILTNYSVRGGPGVCKTHCLVTYFAAMEPFPLINSS